MESRIETVIDAGDLKARAEKAIAFKAEIDRLDLQSAEAVVFIHLNPDNTVAMGVMGDGGRIFALLQYAAEMLASKLPDMEFAANMKQHPEN